MVELPNQTLKALEAALNRYLALDPYTPPAIGALDGRVVALEIVGLGIRLLLLPRADGHLALAQGPEPAAECTLSGTPLDLLRSGDPVAGRRLLFAGNVHIDGDAELGRKIGEILGSIDIDWEEQLSRLVGDVAAHQLGRAGRAAAGYSTQSGRTLRDNLAEYLTEEARWLPTRFECEQFRADVERLRDDVERMQKRADRLARRRHAEDAS